MAQGLPMDTYCRCLGCMPIRDGRGLPDGGPVMDVMGGKG